MPLCKGNMLHRAANTSTMLIAVSLLKPELVLLFVTKLVRYSIWINMVVLLT